MVLETIQPVLSNYFLNPAGLIALSALLPLIIFYLIKKDPEKEVMPSFMFFQNSGESESTSQAFRMISRNFLLLLHILIVTGFALAFAEPFLEGAGQPENSVLILDRSGSIAELEDAKSFLLDKTGEQNTVIVVEDEARIVAERVPDYRAETLIRNIKPAQTETDIVSGLETAKRFQGSVFVASDLDQTVDNRDPEQILDRFRSAGKRFQVIETERRNRHGIVDIDVGERNTSIDVKNFEDRTKTVEVSSENQKENIEINGKSVETIQFESRTGRNTVNIEDDKFKADNTAYFYIPEDKNIEVAFISDKENRYLAKVFELIDFTSMTHYDTPVDEDLNADMYIIGDSEGMLSQTVRDIQEDVREGKANLVLFGKSGFSSLDFQDLPVRDNGNTINQTVTIKKPVETSLGEMEIRNIEKISGERYSADSNAVIRSEHGSGEFLLYNIEDQSFRNNFLYPVFWKEITMEMTDNPSTSDLNLMTGAEISRESIISPEGAEYSGRTKLTQTGFYETSKGTVAANMLSEDESLRDATDTEELSGTGETTELSLQKYFVIMILIMTLLEFGYLYRLGELK
ncbi:MAG: hypothetical protein BRC27_02970 [Nanohaloarchaea archaeon SW_10_44_10]|nr:MAG: hypothetical protein BRC27_02970 [Nanohaloarchaea archaeon SW_10_44_10]